MAEENEFVLEERPETDVYDTDTGFIGIRQKLRGKETIILLTPNETAKVIEYLKTCLAKLSK